MTNLRRIPWGDLALAALGLALCALMLTGCIESRSETQRVEVERTRGIQAGQPVDLMTTRQSEESAKVQTGADPAAIAAAVSQAVKAAIPGADAIAGAVRAVIPPPADLSPLRADLAALSARPVPDLKPITDQIQAMSRPAPAPTGIDGTTGTAAAIATAAAGWAAKEWMAHRETKQDSAEGWAAAKEAQARAEAYALQLPPKA